MLFGIDRDEVVGAVGASQVSCLSSEDAERYGFRGEVRDFLVAVGIPRSSKFDFCVQPFSSEHVLTMERLAEDDWFPSVEVDGWLDLGTFPVSPVALASDGVVYQFSEEADDVIAIHGDLSSFVRTIVDVEMFLRQYVPLADWDEAFTVREAAMDAVRRRIEAVDPLPFGNEFSEWHSVIGEIKEGSWV